VSDPSANPSADQGAAQSSARVNAPTTRRPSAAIYSTPTTYLEPALNANEAVTAVIDAPREFLVRSARNGSNDMLHDQ
jgi:hypothetical protein